MHWLSITIEADDQHAEILSDALVELGALSVETSDAEADSPNENAVFAEPDIPTTLWKKNKITALFDANVQADKIVQQAAHICELSIPLNFNQSFIEEQDWVKSTQAQFQPIKISERLWITPSWHESPDSEAICLTLDPGLAFGTGSHPTTALCLRWLNNHIKGEEIILDYGCGSGILTIAALKLGAKIAVGIDIDAQAVEVSKRNAELNYVDAQFFTPNEAPRLQANIVIANILANPLKLLAPMLAQSTFTGGHIVLSGILKEQANDVITQYSRWFDMNHLSEDNNWVCLSGIKINS